MQQSTDLSNLEFPIEKLQGGNIDTRILNGKRGAMILFYADWCFHCKHLKPTYKSFAEKNKNGDIIIGVVDMVKNGDMANKNLIPLHIDGFPTILSFDSKGKYFSTFSGGRDEENLNLFIKYIGDYSYINNNMDKINGGKDEVFSI